MTKHIEIPFFGRKPELAELEDRCAHPGVTIVKGPPRVGKSRLLNEFKLRSRAYGSRRVGFAEAGEAQGDALLRALRDAYDHWLTDANALKQLKSIHEQMQGKYISKVGPALGKALADFTGPAKGLVSTLFDGLSKAQQMLETGGIQLPRLTSEQARDLLAILAFNQNVPVVAILNQWEHGQSLAHDAATIRVLLDNLNHWPSVHILLHLREPRFPDQPNPQAHQVAELMIRDFPPAKWLLVEPLDLEDDADSQDSLLRWAREYFPAFRDVADDDILNEFAGQPAVFEEWVALDESGRKSLSRICEAAANARAKRSPEIRKAYDRLLEAAVDPAAVPRLELALLAAALPLPPEADSQRALLPAILGEAAESDLAYLESLDLLRPQGAGPLSLGHPSRLEDARFILGLTDGSEPPQDKLAQRLRPYLRRAFERVVPALVDLHSAESWSRLDTSARPVADALAGANAPVSAVGADDRARLLCAAALTLFGGAGEGLASFEAGTIGRMATPSQRTLIALALNNAVGHSGSDTARADDLLGELRTLSGDHPSEQALREQLAKGLNNAIADSGSDSARADDLLGELRTLSGDHPSEPALREQLARGLFNAFHYSEPNSARADDLLGELRDLSGDHPSEPAVREQLAKGLFNAFHHSEPNSTRADDLLGELRTLSGDHPSEPALRERLAKGLTNAIAHSGSDTARADGLLGELRTLAGDHPSEPALREKLAVGLNNAIADSGSDTARADGLLGELRGLAAAHPAETAIWACMLRACGSSMRGRRSDADAVAAFLNEAAEALPRCPTDDETRQICLLIVDDARAAEVVADEAGKRLIDQAGAAFWAAYKTKWPDQGES